MYSTGYKHVISIDDVRGCTYQGTRLSISGTPSDFTTEQVLDIFADLVSRRNEKSWIVSSVDYRRAGINGNENSFRELTYKQVTIEYGLIDRTERYYGVDTKLYNFNQYVLVLDATPSGDTTATLFEKTDLNYIFHGHNKLDLDYKSLHKKCGEHVICGTMFDESGNAYGAEWAISNGHYIDWEIPIRIDAA